MEAYTDEVIESIKKHIPKDNSFWEVLGFINKNSEVLTFGNDSKIIGRLFEILLSNSLNEVAKDLGFEFHENLKQTVYPDFYFIKPDGRKIAIDVKTTYRGFCPAGNVKSFAFTAGSFTSFMRGDGTKNIVGNYSDYDKHYIIGVLYSRETNPTKGKLQLSNLQEIIPPYKDPEIFVQEKFRICGEKKGSGNTDNIGTIKDSSIEPFIGGFGPFAFLGIDAFNSYWSNYPYYKMPTAEKKELYSNIEEYLIWLRKIDSKLADFYEEKYKEYLDFKSKK